MSFSVKATELAKNLKWALQGDDVTITSCCPIDDCKESSLVFIKNESYLEWLDKIPVNVLVIVQESLRKHCMGKPQSFVFSDHARLAFASAAEICMSYSTDGSPNIHPTAIISERAEMDSTVKVGPYTIIEAVSKIESNTVIGSFVQIYDRVTIGRNCKIHSHCTIGSEGFGFERIKGKLEKVPQVGALIIEDDVEIFDHCNIDRSMIGNTVIGKGTKIDRHCHVAHGCKIGKNCALTAGVVFSGTVTVGDGTWIGPNSSLINNNTIGDNVFIGIGAVVVKEIPQGEIWAGNPARFFRENKNA